MAAISTGVLILFCVIAAALVILCFVAFCARKYLRGDFIKDDVENKYDIEAKPLLDDKEEAVFVDKEQTYRDTLNKYRKDDGGKDVVVRETKPEPTTLSLLQSAQRFNVDLQQTESSRIYDVDPSGSFAGNASVDLTLKYVESSKCIVGNIKSIHGLNLGTLSCPKDICFHMKLLPKGRYRMHTPWRPSSATDLSLTFTIGPVKTSKILKCFFCARLYGRMTSSKFARPSCFGEFTVQLSHLLGKEGGLELTKYLCPKNRFESTEELRFTDPESDIM